MANSTSSQPSVEASDLSLRGALRLLVASGTGKAGALLFAVMLGISAYVLLTYPADFGRTRWSNPAVWADNPNAVPPVWTSWLSGGDEVAHTVVTTDVPAETRAIAAGEVRTFDLPLEHNTAAFPTGLSLTLTGLTYYDRAPVILTSLVRPDGTEVRLANIAVSAPRPGESAPFRRFYESPERVLLTAQEVAARSVTDLYAQEYSGEAIPGDLSGRLEDALFGRPAEDGSGNLVPLPGMYALRVQVVVGDTRDEVATIRGVLGGTVFGWMGTDTLGRNLMEGLLYGFPVGLLIAALAALLSTFIGASLGILSGYAGGATDTLIQRLSDIISNVPVLPLLIFLVFVLGSHLYLIILVLVAFSWPGLTILVRSMVLQIRAGGLVEAARALGASRRRIMVRHVFPQVAPFIVAQMIFFAPGAILAEASLSFLGLGDQSIPTWGQMLEAGFRTGALYVGYWWWVIPPGILIVVTALAFMLLALAMEPIVDPRLRKVN
ncbi:MAG: ABC transporter permease [Chloroflexota bacterium]|nr:ABC transporter permease [Chloroflexota bacterium]